MLERDEMAKGYGSSVRNSFVPRIRRSVWARLGIAWDAALNTLAPMGYEDEKGFHYGTIPSDRK